jgi:exodeoxyribonuclease V alpha subunit
MIQITGFIHDVTFHNEDNGFTIMQMDCANGNRITCVGTLLAVNKGENLLCQGEWTVHKKYGRQFEIKSYEIIRPTTPESIEAFLASGIIPHIGPSRAKAIVKAFGEKALDILDNNPDSLTQVPGIGKKYSEKIKSTWGTHKHLRTLMMFLQEYGVTLNLGMKIYKAYGPDAQKKICENPYSLVESVWGVGFIKADQIAQRMGFAHDSYKRIRAGLIHIMQDECSKGHVFQNFTDLKNKAVEILDVAEDQIIFSIDHAIEANLFIRTDDCIYLPQYHDAEIFIASDLKKRLHQRVTFFSQDKIDSYINVCKLKNNWEPDPRQLDAFTMALSNPVFILTGGPGTGKTTTLQLIVGFFQSISKKVLLAAPTGRAAQRMGTVSGCEAQTIHRLLEYKPSDGGLIFGKNETNRLECDVVIIDEVSMIDLLLMKSLLQAINHKTCIILVGDSNQLPSVGAGNVLADCISSKIIPHVNLTTVFRQAAASRIVTSAHEIIQGKMPVFTNTHTDDCFLLLREDPQECLDTIINLVTIRLPSRYGFNPVDDIQVLAPMHNGLLGTENLNILLQQKLNENPHKLIRGNKTYFLGDKVMQTRNNYDVGVFNGDIGKVVAVSHDESLIVEFDKKRVHYEMKDLDELQPAYCISIHKSQGCEFKAVIIPVSTQHYIMLQRNLVYTAVTRAKKICILVGTSKALSIAIKNNSAQRRNSRLADLLAG